MVDASYYMLFLFILYAFLEARACKPMPPLRFLHASGTKRFKNPKAKNHTSFHV